MDRNNTKASELWNSKWPPETHLTEYAMKRIKSAQSAKLTPIKIDKTNCCGYFQGNYGRYETFLDSCSCVDFNRGKLPCKHIYRLAIELGLMNINSASNLNAVLTPKSERLSLDKIFDIIEKLSLDVQKELLRITGNISSSSPLYLVSKNNFIIELLNSEIIYDSDPENHLVNFGTKADISMLLESENIEYNKKATKSELMDICLKNIPHKSMERFGEIFYVGISGTFSPYTHKIHTYLHRKYDSETFIDEESMTLYEISLLATVLPEDDITNQLIKRGYYTEKG